MLTACQSELNSEAEISDLDKLYQKALVKNTSDKRENLIEMKRAVGVFQMELERVRKTLTQVQASASSQSAIILSAEEYTEVNRLMEELEGIMMPLGEGLPGSKLPFQYDLPPDSTQTGIFGEPPLANVKVLDQLMEDVHETEEAILAAFQ